MASANGTASKKPLFSFGLIADVQHADIPNGYSFRGVPRYYQHSIDVLRHAVRAWNDHPKLSFVLNFGDIVDGLCPRAKSQQTIEKVSKVFDEFQGPVHHIVGNHCLYNLPRSKLLPLLRIPSSTDDSAYYDFSPTPEFRVVVLDSFDVSAVGRARDHLKTVKATEFLSLKNPNSDKNSTDGLVGLDKRFVMFNGAFGMDQLQWLDNLLQDAARNNQKVIVCCHQPLDSDASSPEALPWNYDEAMGVIHRYDCVKACFAGHDHRGGHCVDSHGVHHRVLEAALECPPGSDSFGYIEVYDDRLSLFGTDRMASTEMVFSSQLGCKFLIHA